MKIDKIQWFASCETVLLTKQQMACAFIYKNCTNSINVVLNTAMKL